MIRLDDALAGVSRLGLDTSPVIYYVEAHPQYDPVVADVFNRIANGHISATTPLITLAEVLVQPLRLGNAALEARYRSLLLGSRNLRTLPISLTDADRAADVRARYNLRLADSLQIAVALREGCEAFLPNDTKLSRVTEMHILVLDELTL